MLRVGVFRPLEDKKCGPILFAKSGRIEDSIRQGEARLEEGKREMNRLLRAFPRVMGIVNLNDDSFSGDGTLDVKEALHQAICQVLDGADIIDIGAESARTNRDAISIGEEVDRLLPFIDSFSLAIEELQPRDSAQIWPPKLSVNTWRPGVVAEVLKTGKVNIINDIGGMVEDSNARLCFEYEAALLIMHTVGLPKEPHFNQHYTDVWGELEQFSIAVFDLSFRREASVESVLVRTRQSTGHTNPYLQTRALSEARSCYLLCMMRPGIRQRIRDPSSQT